MWKYRVHKFPLDNRPHFQWLKSRCSCETVRKILDVKQAHVTGTPPPVVQAAVSDTCSRPSAIEEGPRLCCYYLAAPEDRDRLKWSQQATEGIWDMETAATHPAELTQEPS
ncbi:hypothetical protein Q5P01_023689 [Channa striata]|uniref:Uncharacterized protein n=1 Tax=Channa striata TaxID=64152 RepID=A0AA88LNZ9_CHASR|nr:hypothetical protein Q5P01_023689 [Channa striata]